MHIFLIVVSIPPERKFPILQALVWKPFLILNENNLF